MWTSLRGTRGEIVGGDDGTRPRGHSHGDEHAVRGGSGGERGVLLESLYDGLGDEDVVAALDSSHGYGKDGAEALNAA